jgi:hypothetical protein
MTNSSMCLAFGAAFSFSLLRIRSLLWRIEGAVFLLLYCLAIALRGQLRLAMTTS